MFENSSNENSGLFEADSEVLEPIQKRSKVKLEDLLENLGPMEEVDWGEPRGQEIW